jgi:hypothetical protein
VNPHEDHKKHEEAETGLIGSCSGLTSPVPGHLIVRFFFVVFMVLFLARVQLTEGA